MAEISYFWNGTTVGDAAASPYEAASLFSSVMSTLSRGINYPNQGYVLDSANAGNRLAVSNAGGGVINVATGTAVVIGTWYNNNSVLGFTIPDNPPSLATRIDRIVLRKTWSTQTVRLTYVEGPANGGGPEPLLLSGYGVVWDIPIAKISITTGGVVTVTDERVLSSSGQAGSSVFIPWRSPGPFPTTNVTRVVGFDDIVALNGVPADATAVVFTFKVNSGTVDFLEFTTATTGVTAVYEAQTGSSIPELLPPPITVPIPSGNPASIEVLNTSAINIDIFVIGWYIPF